MAVLKIALFSVCILLSTANDQFDDTDFYDLRDFCVRLVTNSSVVASWFDPLPLRAEKQGYTLYYSKNPNDALENWNSVTIGVYPMVTLRDIALGEMYYFRVRVNLWKTQTPGPLSEIKQFKFVDRTKACYDQVIRSKTFIRASAISKSSVEAWWNVEYNPDEVKGFVIFYGSSDLGVWYNKTIGIQNSVELVNLVEHETYMITIAAITDFGLYYYSEECKVTVHMEQVPMNVEVFDITADSMVINWSPPIRLTPLYYKISYHGIKDYIDSNGVRQHYRLDNIETLLDHQVTSFELLDLRPYTSYFINISAVPVDYSYKPSIHLNVKTDVGAPGPMHKPTINGVINGDNIQVLLPKASEENGPISYYFLIVIPQIDVSDDDIPSSTYVTEDLLESQWFDGEEVDAPYIAAKFPSRIPYAFILGVGIHGGFKNYKLDSKKNYRIFVRAIVVTSQGHLLTDSPYSDYFCVETEKEKFGIRYK